MLPAFVTLTIVLAIAVAVLAATCWQVRRRARNELAGLRAEQSDALARHEAERHAIFNALSDAFFLIDSTGCIRFANTQAGALFAGRPLLDRHLDEVFLDRRLSQPIRDALEGDVQVTSEVILPQQASPLGGGDRRGETAWIVDAGPIQANLRPQLTRVLIRDSTANHQTEQVRKDFVANASHELRTPLAIINGYLENLLDDDLLNDPAASRRFLQIMKKHGERIARIVEDMLVISRLESGEAGALKMRPFHLGACVRDVLERLEPVISTQKARVKILEDPPDLVINGDRFYWTQVLFNLVENSFKQNPHVPLKVKVGWRKEADGSLRLWVSDNGVGIPAGDLPFIFRRFYRVEKHHSQIEIKGTGLGLSIVKRAVEAHGGTIGVTSTPGKETRFEISLPAEAVEDGSEVDDEKKEAKAS